MFWQIISFPLFLCLDMFGHGFDCTKYTLHSTKYALHSTKCTLHSTKYTAHSTDYTVQSTQYRLFSKMYTVQITQYKVHITQYKVWGFQQIGISGVKQQGSNPGSLLRSKSTRRDRRCEAASERLVSITCIIIFFLLWFSVPS